MVSDSAGGYTVLVNGNAMATDVPFEVAHEFVHQGCLLCAADEDHITPNILQEIA